MVLKFIKLIFLVVISLVFVNANENEKLVVKIGKKLPFFYIKQNGKLIKIERIQDVGNRLSDDFTKTSRPCPPYCIQPITIADGVRTIGELELIDYVKDKNTVLIDARPKEWYDLESLPKSINIPEKVTRVESIRDNLFKILGAKKSGDRFDFSNAKRLVVYGNGPWSPEASKFIKNMLRLGYPADKMLFYRDGLQGWKILGLTTVVRKAEEIK
jgi:rhodanese-related sulfurtransferase